jgi:hypothetical protein
MMGEHCPIRAVIPRLFSHHFLPRISRSADPPRPALTGPRSLPCSLVGFWRPKKADLLYKFPVQPPDLLYFGPTFGPKFPFSAVGGPKVSLLDSFSTISTLYSHFPTTLESFSSILGLRNESHLGLMWMLCQKRISRSARFTLFQSSFGLFQPVLLYKMAGDRAILGR